MQIIKTFSLVIKGEGDINIFKKISKNWIIIFPNLGGMVFEQQASHPLYCNRRTGLIQVLDLILRLKMSDGANVFRISETLILQFWEANLERRKGLGKHGICRSVLYKKSIILTVFEAGEGFMGSEMERGDNGFNSSCKKIY